jgi:hypothetical protein
MTSSWNPCFRIIIIGPIPFSTELAIACVQLRMCMRILPVYKMQLHTEYTQSGVCTRTRHSICVQMMTHIGMALTVCTNDYAHWRGIVLRVQMITHIGMALYFVYKWLRTFAWYCTCTSCTTMCAWGYGTQPYGIAQIHSCFVNNFSSFSFEF